jgi:hypothetical protein
VTEKLRSKVNESIPTYENSSFLPCSIMFFWKSEKIQITVVGFVFTFFCRTNHATFELTHLNIIHVSPPLVENQLRQPRL